MISQKTPWETLDRLRNGADVDTPPVLHDRTVAHVLPSHIAKKLIALANTPTGGIWFVGICGHTGWGDSKGDLPADLEARIHDAKRKIEPASVDVRVHRRGSVAALTVVGAPGRHGSYHERGSSRETGTYLYDDGRIICASKEEVHEIRDRAGEGQFELGTITGRRSSDLHRGLLSAVGFDPDDGKALRDAGITDSYGHPTIAGLIAFGDPSVFDRFPSMGIVWRRYQHGAAETEIHGIDPVDEDFPQGHLAAIVEEVVGRMVEWLPETRRPGDAQRLCKELVVNSVGHRSLSPYRIGTAAIEGAAAAMRLFSAYQGFVEPKAEPVTVDCFPDLIRITNPGPLPLGRVRQLGPDGVKDRLARNPHLLDLLTRKGLATQKGLGLAFVRRFAPLIGCRFELQNHQDRLETRLRVDPDRVIDTDRGTVGVPAKRRRLGSTERQEQVVGLLEGGPMTAAELVEQLGWPQSTVSYVIRSLLKQGAVKRTSRAPRSPNQSYRLA